MLISQLIIDCHAIRYCSGVSARSSAALQHRLVCTACIVSFVTWCRAVSELTLVAKQQHQQQWQWDDGYDASRCRIEH